MAYGRDGILYRRNVLPAHLKYGPRVVAADTGFITVKGYCIQSDKGLIDIRRTQPDIDPKTGSYYKT